MALSADTTRVIRERTQLAWRVANASQLYAGSFLSLRGEDYATTADRGYIAPWASAAGEIPLGGFSETKKLGDTAASPVPESRGAAGGFVLEGVAVTGVDGVNDHGRSVYLSDDNTLTLTRPTVGIPAGVVVRHKSSTTCDVYLFSFGELLVLSYAGCGQDMIYLGSFDASVVNPSAPGTKSDIRTGIAMPYHGEILSFYAICDVAATATSTGDSYAVSLEIGGTDVTGGVLTLGAAALGAKSSATAITAANVFHEGDLLDIEITETATGDNLTAGRFDLWIEVARKAGI